MGRSRSESEREGIVQAVFPEVDPYPAVREPGVKVVLRAAVLPDKFLRKEEPILYERQPRAETFGANTSIAIQKYVDEALASSGTRRVAPLPRARAARGSEPPQPNGQFAGMSLRPSEVGLADTLPGDPKVWHVADDDDSILEDDFEGDDTDEAPIPSGM